MIRIEFEEGLFCPVIVCDCCGSRVRSQKEAIVLWEMNTAGLVDGCVFIVHKGGCDDLFCSARGYDFSHWREYWWSIELSDFILDIAYNTTASDEVICHDVMRFDPGFIYVIRAGEKFKIGKSQNPTARIKDLSSSIPEKVETIEVIEVDDMTWAEKTAHKTFANKRLRGEWFLLGANDINIVRRIGEMSNRRQDHLP